MRSLYYLNLSYTNNGAQVSKIYKFYANGQMAVESIVNTLHLKLAGKDNVRIFIQPASPLSLIHI